MAKKKIAPKKSKKTAPKTTKAKAKSSAVKAKKSAPAKAKVAAKGKVVAKAKSKLAVKAKSKVAKASGKFAAKPAAVKTTVAKGHKAPRREAADSDTDFRANQEVEIVRPKARSRVARAGAGSGDLQGISSVVEADSESEDELLEEGQSFEAGIIEGVERAGNGESEVVTHEVLEDDVPREYDDQDK